jgi:putative DNA methylase
MTTIKTPKKLIEVALPLDAINDACGKEKSIRHSHPSTIHLWWARRPLAAARAVIFAQMVNDPGYERSLGRGVNKEKAKIERERLFGIIRRMVLWDNIDDHGLMEEASVEIRSSWRETCELNRTHPEASTLFNPEKLPNFHDPFAGGGAIPLEAQRLGLTSFASDLNPVAVLINKSMIEIPQKFMGREPVAARGAPKSSKDATRDSFEDWSGARGLAEDLRRYSTVLRDLALKKIGHLYPKVAVPDDLGGGNATVIAYLWARTVKSPNPAFSHVDVPLAATFVLSAKPGKETYIIPVINGDKYHFEIKQGKPSEATKGGTKASGRGANFICMLSGTPIGGDYIKAEGQAGRMGTRLLAVVAEAQRGRLYVAPMQEMEDLANSAKALWRPSGDVPPRLSGGTCVPYGMKEWGDLFSQRQLVALNTFSDLIDDIKQIVIADARAAGWDDDAKGLAAGGTGPQAYAEAIAIYLAFTRDKVVNWLSTISHWWPGQDKIRPTFTRQALPMTWDYSEANPFAGAAGDFVVAAKGISDAIAKLPNKTHGKASQLDCRLLESESPVVISTDPPYYDNIFYADLSDFFYVWLRRDLKAIYPDIFATMAVPKAEELVATAHRHGGRDNAEKFFLNGMTEAMSRLAELSHPAIPTTIYYAFKQSDSTDTGTGNTGWETFLEAVIRAGFAISGTWPMRTENAGRMVGQGANALASSIVLVCRRRDANAPSASRRDFLRELKEELADALDAMIGGVDGASPVAPVDLAQAVIGPGMAIYSKYSAVLEADGSSMSVHTALTLINRMLTEGADEFDADTQFCLGWFDEQGWSAGEFGKADVLARAKGTFVDHVREAGVVEAGGGKVRLLKPAEFSEDWSPGKDNNTPVWEALHQMIRSLRSDGEGATGELLAGMPQRAEPIRNLAYRLYTLCERKGWAEDARAYNELITSWTSIEAASHDKGRLGSQANLDI